MEFSKIVAISGWPGLYELISTRNNGLVVRSLQNGKAEFVSQRNRQVMALENVAVYCQGEETVGLKELFVRMAEREQQLPVPDIHQPHDVLAEYLEKILPDYDRQRVHTSDLRKIVRWYHELKQRQLLPTGSPSHPPDTPSDAGT